MLQQMRKFASSWVASIFLGLLALSFGVWGVADIFRGNTDTTVAKIGDIEISQDTFQHEYQNLLRNQSTRLGTQISAEQAQAMGLPQQTLQQIISRTALDTEVHRLGLTTTDKAVAEQIKAIPAFAGPSGSFDHNTFLSRIQQAGFTEQSFIAAIRSDNSRSQLLDATNGNLRIPESYARVLFNYLNEARAVQYVVVSPADAGNIAKPSDAQLEVYVKANSNRFSTPEYRELTYAGITPQDLAGEITVTDKQLQNEYELRKSQYEVPEKRDIEQITFPDEKTAAEASAKIEKGASFEDIAKSRGLKPSDIHLGELQETDLGADRGKAAFALTDGGISKPVKGDFGWVLLKITKIVPGTSKSFEDVKDVLKKGVIQKLAENKITDIVNAFEDAMAGGATLVQAADKAGMKTVHVKSVDRQGLANDGSKADVPTASEFLPQVFNADVGVAGDPFQTKDGSAYVLKVDGVTPPKLKPLDQVRQTAETEWMSKQREKALEEKAKALTADANKDKGLDGIAKTLNAKVQKSGAMQRGAPTAEFPVALITKIFDAAPGTSVYGKAAKDGDFIVARVTGVVHPPAAMTADPRYNQFVKQISEQIGQDIPTTLAMAARKRQGVTINQKLVDATVGTGS